MFLYPYLVDLLNLQPDASRIQTVQATVLQTRDRDPHLVLELSHGDQVSAYWPTRVHQLGGSSFFGWTREDRAALVGCQATVELSPIRYWMFFWHKRVWALHCPETGFEVTRTQAQERLIFSLEYNGTLLLIFTLILIAPLGFVFFLRERRGVL